MVAGFTDGFQAGGPRTGAAGDRGVDGASQARATLFGVTTPPAWLDQLQLRPGPAWLVMTVHALDLAGWLAVDDLAHRRRARPYHWRPGRGYET